MEQGTEQNTSPLVEAACEHDNLSCYVVQDTGSFFTLDYYTYNETWPRKCMNSTCNKKFGGPGGIKVTSKNPVMFCPNAVKHDHSCDHAFCMACHAKLLMEKAKETGGVARTQNSRRNTKSSSKA